MRSRNWLYRQNWYPLIQDGGSRHIENYIFCHKSAIIAYICTEFDTAAENGSCSQIYGQNSDGGWFQNSVRRRHLGFLHYANFGGKSGCGTLFSASTNSVQMYATKADLCCKRLQEKRKGRKGKVHKVMFRDNMGSRPRWTDFHKNWHGCSLWVHEVIIYSNFGFNIFRGFRSTGGQSFPFCHWLCWSSLQTVLTLPRSLWYEK